MLKRLYLESCSCENGKYLARILDHSAILCDEIIDVEVKLSNKKTKFNEKN